MERSSPNFMWVLSGSMSLHLGSVVLPEVLRRDRDPCSSSSLVQLFTRCLTSLHFDDRLLYRSYVSRNNYRSTVSKTTALTPLIINN